MHSLEHQIAVTGQRKCCSKNSENVLIQKNMPYLMNAHPAISPEEKQTVVSVANVAASRLAIPYIVCNMCILLHCIYG